MPRIEQSNIKNQINQFSTELYTAGRAQAHWGIPVLILVYFGDEGREKLEGEIKEAFTTMLTVQPVLRSIYVDEDSWGDVEGFGIQLQQILSEVNSEGHFAGGNIEIEVSYIAMMNDPLLQKENAEEFLDGISQQIESLREYGVSFKRNAFYGVFDQKLKDMDYSKAISLVKAGSYHELGIWDKVYHQEKSFLTQTYEKQCRAIAMQVLCDFMFFSGNRTLVERRASEHYQWHSLGLEELKIPEQTLCYILINGYQRQLRGEPMNRQMLEVLEQSLAETMISCIQDQSEIWNYDSMIRFLPQKLEQLPMEPQRNGGWFSGMRRSRPEYVQNIQSFSDRLLDESLFERIVDGILEPVRETMMQEESIRNFIRASLSCMYTLEDNLSHMADQILEAMQSAVSEIYKQAALQERAVESESMDEYRLRRFDMCVNKESLNMAGYLLESYLRRNDIRILVKRTLDELYKEISEQIHILDHLCVAQYGGTETLELPLLVRDFRLPLGTGVPAACNAIPGEALQELIMNTERLSARVQNFLLRAQKSAIQVNAIGITRRDFGSNPTISYTMFTAPDTHISVGIEKKEHAYFRSNSLQVLFSGEWDSQINLRNYYKNVGE